MLRKLVLPLCLFAFACSNDDDKTQTPGGDSDLSGGDQVTTTDDDQPTGDLDTPVDAIVKASVAGRPDPEGIAATPDSLTTLTWKDARHNNRTMTLGAYLYQYDFSFHDGDALVQRSAGDDAFGHAGFGYVVSHSDTTSPLGKEFAPSSVSTTVFSGGHHAVHRIEQEYVRDQGIRIPVTIEWFVATGRDHPIWSVTYKMSSVVNPQSVNFDVYRMDTRGPYGSMLYDGATDKAASDTIGGVWWGDAGYQFRTITQPLTMNSQWTYNTGNDINFSRSWTQTANAEFGIVQARVSDEEMGYADLVNGRQRSKTSANYVHGAGDCAYLMPCVYGWPFQMMNFDWDGGGHADDESTTTTLMAWGSQYGWLGASSFDTINNNSLPGTGDRSYSTFIVVGPKCRMEGGVCSGDGDVVALLDTLHAIAAANVTVSVGTLAAQAARGPGSGQMKNLTKGYNDTYAAFFIDAASNAATFHFIPAGGRPVRTPVFAIRNYTGGLPTIRVNGVARTVNTGTADSDAFVSQDGTTLWVTLNEIFAADSEIAIAP